MRIFTLDEAVELLAEVEPLLRRALDQRQELSEKEQAYNDALQATSSNGHSAADKLSGPRGEIERLSAELQATISTIQETGCVIKDLRMGLLDFPSIRDGQTINLCWRLGEPTIAYWHSMDTGFASRQPL